MKAVITQVASASWAVDILGDAGETVDEGVSRNEHGARVWAHRRIQRLGVPTAERVLVVNGHQLPAHGGRTDGMQRPRTRQHGLNLDRAVVTEMRAEARRLGISMSALAQRAWVLARFVLRQQPAPVGAIEE